VKSWCRRFYCWRKEFGDLKLDHAKRLKELDRENRKLKGLVAELISAMPPAVAREQAGESSTISN